jgi:hypothetical protein
MHVVVLWTTIGYQNFYKEMHLDAKFSSLKVEPRLIANYIQLHLVTF